MDGRTTKEREELEELAQDWALDHGLEYVRIRYNDESLITQSGSHSAGIVSDSDGGGLHRVREALECHMWPACKMKDRRGQFTAAAAKAALDEEEARQDDEADGQVFEDAKSAEHENAVFASMQRQHEDERKEQDIHVVDENGFNDFASANVNGSATKSKPKPSPSDFAAAFARAIRMDDGDDSHQASSSSSSTSTSISNTVPPSSTSTSTSTSAPVDDYIDAPISPSEMESLARDTGNTHTSARINPHSQPSSTESAAADDNDDGDDEQQWSREVESFEAAFASMASLRSKIDAVRNDKSLTDEERRRKAEENLKIILKAMGMEEQLEESDAEKEATAAPSTQ